MTKNETQEYCTGPEELFIEPIYALKTFHVRSNAVCSVTGIHGFDETVWDASRLTARCWVGAHSHGAPPIPECTCGFYAWNESKAFDIHAWAAMFPSFAVVGVAELSGRILVGERGYRAEKARIAALWDLRSKYFPPLDRRCDPIPRFTDWDAMLAAYPLSRVGGALDDDDD